MDHLSFTHYGVHYIADTSNSIDISIAIDFASSKVRAFGAPDPVAAPLAVGGFVGDVNRGGSCNCCTYTLTPHCNGTHTECVGHITHESMSINRIAPRSLLFAAVVSVTPEIIGTASGHDRVITCAMLQQTLHNHRNCNAVIVRTLPNNQKLNINYDSLNPAYFAEDTLQWLASIGVDHLLTDLPSVDRMNDNGLLLAHRAFWGMPRGSTILSDARRGQATITELIFVPDTVADGNYLLNLQVAPMITDAAPSRPLLYPIRKVMEPV